MLLLASMLIPPSTRLDRCLPASDLRESVVLPSASTPEMLQQAFEEVTLREVPLARFLRALRLPPAPLPTDDTRPLVEGLIRLAGFTVLERAPHELVLESSENRVISVRSVAVDGGSLLVLEHGAEPRDESARVRVRDWKMVRAGCAVMTRRLLAAVIRRAERPSHAATIRARRRQESFLVRRPAAPPR